MGGMGGPSVKTVKRLCALSSNRCPFCSLPLVELDSDSFVGEIAHIKGDRPGSPRYDPRQTEDERHAASNLMLLCSTDHTRIDTDPAKYTVEFLMQRKEAHERIANPEIQPVDVARAERLIWKYELRVNGPVSVETIHANTLNISAPRRRSTKLVPPSDVIAGDSEHRRYAKHLIDRYKEFAQRQTDREFQHFRIYKAIEREFGTSWEWIPLSRFDEFASFVQRRIDGTIIGKVNRRNGTPNYSSFEQFRSKHAGA